MAGMVSHMMPGSGGPRQGGSLRRRPPTTHTMITTAWPLGGMALDPQQLGIRGAPTPRSARPPGLRRARAPAGFIDGARAHAPPPSWQTSRSWAAALETSLNIAARQLRPRTGDFRLHLLHGMGPRHLADTSAGSDYASARRRIRPRCGAMRMCGEHSAGRHISNSPNPWPRE